jgi:RNA polymerase sigma factor (sigma-70 family)
LASWSPFDDLYSSESGRLRRLVRCMTGQDAIAEDLVHDAFLRLIRQPEGSVIEPEAWLTRVVRNLTINRLRRESLGIFVAANPEEIEAAPLNHPSVEVELIARESLAACLRAIMALPPRRREIFILHRFHDLTYDAIAARLSISRNTVMVQIVNALADLHRTLGPDFSTRG